MTVRRYPQNFYDEIDLVPDAFRAYGRVPETADRLNSLIRSISIQTLAGNTPRHFHRLI